MESSARLVSKSQKQECAKRVYPHSEDLSMSQEINVIQISDPVVWMKYIIEPGYLIR